jgi:hypothetical protein
VESRLDCAVYRPVGSLGELQWVEEGGWHCGGGWVSTRRAKGSLTTEVRVTGL